MVRLDPSRAFRLFPVVHYYKCYCDDPVLTALYLAISVIIS